MAIKKILLPISGDEDITPLADTAFHLATLFNASVEGVFAHYRRLNFPVGEGADYLALRDVLEQTQRSLDARSEQAQTTYDSWARRYAGVKSTYFGTEGHTETTFARRGWLSDLCVIGTTRQYDTQYWHDVRDALLFRSGRPVLVAPGPAGAEASFDKVLVAWKEGIEAARAVGAAQPFIARAREVHVVSIGNDDDTRVALKDIEDYLRLHHADVSGEMLPTGGRRVGEVLLDKSEAIGRALLVMGAYSHSRWQERIFGGVTEFILHESTSPVLLMH
jgi:nucleotide-binding universal stress UspA family protein